MDSTDLQSFKIWLQIRHDVILTKEKEAISALSSGNRLAYDAGMREKAEMLKNLYKEAEPKLRNIPLANQERIRKILANFSQNAATALSLDSVFYMSALLYPDDYKENEADNLQKLVDSIA